MVLKFVKQWNLFSVSKWHGDKALGIHKLLYKLGGFYSFLNSSGTSNTHCLCGKSFASFHMGSAGWKKQLCKDFFWKYYCPKEDLKHCLMLVPQVAVLCTTPLHATPITWDDAHDYQKLLQQWQLWLYKQPESQPRLLQRVFESRNLGQIVVSWLKSIGISPTFDFSCSN